MPLRRLLLSPRRLLSRLLQGRTPLLLSLLVRGGRVGAPWMCAHVPRWWHPFQLWRWQLLLLSRGIVHRRHLLML